MLEEKKNNLTVFIASTSLVSGVACGVSFKVKLDSCVLNKLKHSNCGNDCFPTGSEEALICYSLFLLVKNMLCENPLSIKRSKVGGVSCGYHNGAFVISYNVKATAAAIRISLGTVLKCLVPAKVYSTYALLCKSLGQSPNRSAFNYTADEISKSIKDHVLCGIVGAIKTVKKVDGKDVKLDIGPMVSQLQSKISADLSDGSKTKPTNHIACDHVDAATMPITGYATYAANSYIIAKSPGVNSHICSNHILLSMKSAQWETLRKKLKASVKQFIDAKFAKLTPENLTAVMAYGALSTSALGTFDVRQMLKDKVTAAQLTQSISAAL